MYIGKENIQFVLASASPRRKEILSRLGLDFQVFPSTFEENLDKSLFHDPRDYVKETAFQKSLNVVDRYPNQDEKEIVIIGSDTIVVLDKEILEKPNDHEHAKEMMRKLSGKVHQVMTAVWILIRKGSRVEKQSHFIEVTNVEFGALTDQMITDYVNTGEPMDKAGGYGYQGLAAFLIPRIDGCYYNVVGFPAFTFLKFLKSILNDNA